MTSLRPARQAAGSVAIAAAAGLLAARTHHYVPLPVEPAQCGAAPELLAVVVARLWPHESPFSLLTAADTAMFAVGIALLVWLIWRLTSRPAIALSIATAVALLPGPTPALRPLSHAAVLVAALWCGLWLPDGWSGSGRSRRIGSWVLLAITAMLWPSLTLGAAALWVAIVISGAIESERPRALVAAVGSAAIAIAAVVVVRAVQLPAPLDCLVPGADIGALVSAARRLFASALIAGPYVSALAALGVFVCAAQPPLKRNAIAAVLLVVMSAGIGADFASPLPVLLWLAAAVGLREVVQICRPTFGGRVAAVALLLLVPVLQWQARARGVPPGNIPDYGHARLSLAGMTTILDALPPGANLVSEDASTSVLLRATEAARPSVRPSAVPVEPARIASRLASGVRVFAMPLAQAMLQDLGVRVEDTSVAGLAELHLGGECRALGPDWRIVQDVMSHTPVFALSARAPEEAGPIVVYGSFTERPILDAIEWPPAARRGFYTTIYDQTIGGDRDQLERDMADDRLPPERFGRAARYIARLELWRTPSAPLRLTVGLGGQPEQFIGHVIAQREPKRMTLCPAFPHNVKGLNP